MGIYGHGISDFTDGPAQPKDFPPNWSLDLPDDVFYRDANNPTQPNYLAWPHASRPYPPGAFLIFTPMSLMSYQLDLGYQWPGYLLAFVFLIFAHIASLKFFTLLNETFPGSNSKLFEWSLLALKIYFYLEMIYWALQGQYQVCMAWPLLECFLQLKRKRYIQGLFCFSIAFFIHLHSMMYAPLVGLICLGFLIDPSQRRNRDLSLSAKDVGLLALSIVMSGLAAYCLFRNLSPYTSGQLSSSNPWFWRSWANLTWQQLVPFLLVMVTFVGISLKARSFLTVVTFFAICCIFVLGSNLGAWYTVAVLPLFITASWSKHPRWALVGAVIAHVLITGTFLANSPFEFYFIRAYFMAPLG